MFKINEEKNCTRKSNPCVDLKKKMYFLNYYTAPLWKFGQLEKFCWFKICPEILWEDIFSLNFSSCLNFSYLCIPTARNSASVHSHTNMYTITKEN